MFVLCYGGDSKVELQLTPAELQPDRNAAIWHAGQPLTLVASRSKVATSPWGQWPGREKSKKIYHSNRVLV